MRQYFGHILYLYFIATFVKQNSIIVYTIFSVSDKTSNGKAISWKCICRPIVEFHTRRIRHFETFLWHLGNDLFGTVQDKSTPRQVGPSAYNKADHLHIIQIEPSKNERNFIIKCSIY